MLRWTQHQVCMKCGSSTDSEMKPSLIPVLSLLKAPESLLHERLVEAKNSRRPEIISLPVLVTWSEDPPLVTKWCRFDSHLPNVRTLELVADKP